MPSISAAAGAISSAWQLLTDAQDHGERLERQKRETDLRNAGGGASNPAPQAPSIVDRLAVWNTEQGLSQNPVTLLDVLRVLADDPFTGQRLRSGAAPNLRASLSTTFRPIVFGEGARRAISPVTAEQLRGDLATLQTLDWMAPDRSGTSQARVRYDLPCRIREAEGNPEASQRRPDFDEVRGRTLASRLAYLRDIRDQLDDAAIANRIASCLMTVNPIFAENVLLYAVLEAVNAATRRPGWDVGRDALEQYSAAISEADGDALKTRLLPGWPLERLGTSDPTRFWWAVRVRTFDGRLIRMRLPHAEELRRNHVAQSPLVERLHDLRERLREHFVLNATTDGPSAVDGPGQMPLPGDADARQAIGHGLALRYWSGPHQTGHAAWLADCWAMNSRGERMRKPEWGWTVL